MKKKGFTLVELMMVIAILAVLLGIITTAAMASIRKARERRTQASKLTLQNGIWRFPSSGRSACISSEMTMRPCRRQISAGKGAKNRVLDPGGLLVMNASNQDGSRSSVDYRSAATKKGKYGKRMSAREMTVVYQDAGSGRAYRFIIEYNTESDEVTVMTRGEFGSWKGNEVWR